MTTLDDAILYAAIALLGWALLMLALDVLFRALEWISASAGSALKLARRVRQAPVAVDRRRDGPSHAARSDIRRSASISASRSPGGTFR